MHHTTRHAAEGLLAITSLSRALGGDARLTDVGSLLWMIFRHSMPCEAMALFVIDDARGHVAVRFAAGHHAHAIRTVSRPIGTGIAGAAAVHWKPMVNGDPAFDIGKCAIDSARPLRSCLAVPLVDGESLIAIMALYSAAPGAFSEDHVRLMDLVAPKVASALVDVAILEEDALARQARLVLDGSSASSPSPLQLVQPAGSVTPAARPRGRRATRAARAPRMPAATQPAVS